MSSHQLLFKDPTSRFPNGCAEAMVFYEPKLRFLLPFLEKKDYYRPVTSLKPWLVGFLGASPQTPVAPLRGELVELWSSYKAELPFLLQYYRLATSLKTWLAVFWGPAPNQTPVAPLRGELVELWSTTKQNYAFCFLFWKKKNAIY
jgi:hypothetical protein